MTTNTEQPTVCATCYADLRRIVTGPHGTPERSLIPYYARTADGEAICYSCAERAEVAALADPAVTRYTVYVSQDGRTVTSWTGAVLGTITWQRNGRADRRRWLSPRLISYNVRTPDGRMWCGRGAGPGMCLNLRTMKGR